MIVMVVALISPGFASATIIVIVRHLLAPILSVASIKPLSISSNAPSKSLAIKGIAAILSGITAAVAPMLVPTRARESGNSKMIRMMKGKERTILTIEPKIALSVG